VATERTLTLYLDKQELVTLMALGTSPEILVLGWLRNQRLVRDIEQIKAIQVDWETDSVAITNEYGLGFIPFGWESFDLTLPRNIWFRRLFQELIGRLRSSESKAMAKQLTGYDLREAGELVWGDE
jgi:hypothetical protein